MAALDSYLDGTAKTQKMFFQLFLTVTYRERESLELHGKTIGLYSGPNQEVEERRYT